MTTWRDAPHTDKAAEALLLDHMDCNLGFYRDRERVVRAVLDAVGYDALRAFVTWLVEMDDPASADGRVTLTEIIARAQAALDGDA